MILLGLLEDSLPEVQQKNGTTFHYSIRKLIDTVQQLLGMLILENILVESSAHTTEKLQENKKAHSSVIQQLSEMPFT